MLLAALLGAVMLLGGCATASQQKKDVSAAADSQALRLNEIKIKKECLDLKNKAAASHRYDPLTDEQKAFLTECFREGRVSAPSILGCPSPEEMGKKDKKEICLTPVLLSCIARQKLLVAGNGNPTSEEVLQMEVRVCGTSTSQIQPTTTAPCRAKWGDHCYSKEEFQKLSSGEVETTTGYRGGIVQGGAYDRVTKKSGVGGW